LHRGLLARGGPPRHRVLHPFGGGARAASRTARGVRRSPPSRPRRPPWPPGLSTGRRQRPAAHPGPDVSTAHPAPPRADHRAGDRHDADYPTAVLAAAHEAGAGVLVLCDTNGGMLPHQVAEIIEDLRGRLDAAGAGAARLGAHTHNDTGCAVANAIAAVRSGITHVQGCVNGYGERTGNADLVTLLANLQLKMGMELLPAETLAETTRIAHAIGEIVNMPVTPRAPYAGASAFAHKAGLHASAIRVDPDL